MEKPLGQDKDREIPYHLPSGGRKTFPREFFFNLLTCEMEFNSEKPRKIGKHLSSAISFLHVHLRSMCQLSTEKLTCEANMCRLSCGDK